MTETSDRLLAAVRHYGIDLVAFADSTRLTEPSDKPAPRRTAARAGLARAAQAHAADVPRFLCTLAEAFDTMGVTYGSLADPDGETREHYSMIGAALADSPRARSAAAAAKAMNEPVVLPAATVAAEEAALGLAASGLADALRSGRNARSLVAAVFALVARSQLDLPNAWALVSSAPAAIMGLVDRGTLDHGKRADIVVIDRATRRVEMTIARGHLTHLGPSAAARLRAAAPVLGIVAE